MSKSLKFASNLKMSSKFISKSSISVQHFDFVLGNGGQWIMGKCADTFGPIGPWVEEKFDKENVQK